MDLGILRLVLDGVVKPLRPGENQDIVGLGIIGLGLGRFVAGLGGFRGHGRAMLV